MKQLVRYRVKLPRRLAGKGGKGPDTPQRDIQEKNPSRSNIPLRNPYALSLSPSPPPSPRGPFDRSLQLIRHPAPIKASFLRSGLFAIDKTLPGPHVETHKALDRTERLRGIFIRPRAIPHHDVRIVGVREGMICRDTFPFTERRACR